jgi:Flp pilus assembly pilin Flp
MKSITHKKFNRLVKGTRGATLVEYALMLLLVLIAGFAAFRTLGQSASTATMSASAKLQ